MFGQDLATPVAPDMDPRGFPSPARDYFHGGIDLNRHLIRDRTSTFVMRVAGSSMAGAGISDGDEIIVDRALTPKDRSVVVAVVDGELVIRRFLTHDGATSLGAEPAAEPSAQPAGQPSTATGTPGAVRLPAGGAAQEEKFAGEFTVWGVVTRCLHHV